eukprot:m.422177 g.422177  ORF g.422177 m.422177 type:complete len:104 (+) comp16852_c0_seq5:411-722(+)
MRAFRALPCCRAAEVVMKQPPLTLNSADSAAASCFCTTRGSICLKVARSGTVVAFGQMGGAATRWRFILAVREEELVCIKSANFHVLSVCLRARSVPKFLNFR